MLSYHVFDGKGWLADDERSWTPNFDHAASFSSAQLAKDVGEREGGKNGAVIYVFGLLPS